MTAREDVLARVRAAIGDAPRTTPVVPRDYDTVGVLPAGAEELVALFEDRLVDYRASVRRTAQSGVTAAIADVLAERAAPGARVVVPAGIDPAWTAGANVVVDDGSLPAADLDRIDAVLTACAVAVAETGTIVLDAQPNQGRRAISLVPDLHICVVRAEQIVQNVPDALRLLEPTRPLTFISGGSATSDIELQRVEGVHGPRTLAVIVVND